MMATTRATLLLRLSLIVGITAMLAISIVRRHEPQRPNEVVTTLRQLATNEELLKQQTGAYVAMPAVSIGSCRYAVSIGARTDTLTPPAGFKNSRGGTGAESGITASWWYMLASCDDDGGGKSYYASSVDPALQAQRSRQ